MLQPTAKKVPKNCKIKVLKEPKMVKDIYKRLALFLGRETMKYEAELIEGDSGDEKIAPAVFGPTVSEGKAGELKCMWEQSRNSLTSGVCMMLLI